MMKETYKIENLKCGGCAATIIKAISAFKEVKNVEVDVENSIVLVETTGNIKTNITEKLSKLGYPIVGDKNTVVHKAKSFVSCAIGRVNS